VLAENLAGAGDGLTPVGGAKTVAILLAATALLGCDRQAGAVAHRAGQPEVEMVAPDDSAMNAAMGTARATLDRLAERIARPPAGQSNLALKVRLEEGEAVEHIWLTDLGYADGRFFGRVSNEPLDLRKVRLGDSVSAGREEISDWMAVENGRLVGGYTLRVLRDRMSPAERAELDTSWTFRIEQE